MITKNKEEIEKIGKEMLEKGYLKKVKGGYIDSDLANYILENENKIRNHFCAGEKVWEPICAEWLKEQEKLI